MSDPVTRDELKQIVSETVKETLVQLGVDVMNPLEMQKDLQAIREWREAYSSLRNKAVLTLVGILVTGAVAALWVGLKHFTTGGK